jgi:hypothetical protein
MIARKAERVQLTAQKDCQPSAHRAMLGEGPMTVVKLPQVMIDDAIDEVPIWMVIKSRLLH